MKNKIKIFLSAIAIYAISFCSFVYAETVTATIQNPLGSLTSIPTFIANALSFVAKIGGVLAIFFLVYAGYLYVKARGNPGEIEKAHEAFKGTIYGIVLLLGAQLISSIIIGTINALSK